MVREALTPLAAYEILSFLKMLKIRQGCSEDVLIRLVNTGRMRWWLREYERHLFKILPQLNVGSSDDSGSLPSFNSNSR
jgi:hypothetical protein